MKVMKRSHTGSSLLLDSSTVPVSAENASPHLGQRHLWRPAGVLPSLEQSGKPQVGQGGLGPEQGPALSFCDGSAEGLEPVGVE